MNNKVRATEGAEYGVFKTYSSWFNNRTRNVYTTGSSPYPWTRLGYTYDWGSSNHVGLSEYCGIFCAIKTGNYRSTRITGLLRELRVLRGFVVNCLRE